MRSIAKHALINGRVRTMDSDCSLAEAVLIAGDRIESVGSTQEVLAAAGPDAAITDLEQLTDVYRRFIALYFKTFGGADAG